jgi:hypothetical protein
MENAYSVAALVLSLSGLVVAWSVSLGVDRRLREHLRDRDNPHPSWTHRTEAKPPPEAGSHFVLSDQEIAATERQLLARSRQRAAVLAADAHTKLIRTFRPGS